MEKTGEQNACIVNSYKKEETPERTAVYTSATGVRKAAL